MNNGCSSIEKFLQYDVNNKNRFGIRYISFIVIYSGDIKKIKYLFISFKKS